MDDDDDGAEHWRSDFGLVSFGPSLVYSVGTVSWIHLLFVFEIVSGKCDQYISINEYSWIYSSSVFLLDSIVLGLCEPNPAVLPLVLLHSGSEYRGLVCGNVGQWLIIGWTSDSGELSADDISGAGIVPSDCDVQYVLQRETH